MAPLSAPFVAGALAYMLATFNGGYLWYTVLFTKQYLSLQIWSRLVDPAIHFGVVAVALQVRVCGRKLDACLPKLTTASKRTTQRLAYDRVAYRTAAIRGTAALAVYHDVDNRTSAMS